MNTGSIREIIEATHKNDTEVTKLCRLCDAVRLGVEEFDDVCCFSPNVKRDIRGNCFQEIFGCITNGIHVGGDAPVDLVVNRNTVQTKTPYKQGTNKNKVTFKTYKTHGGEQRPCSYNEFADYLVGLVRYEPCMDVLIIPKEDLPRDPVDPSCIAQCISICWRDHPGLNAYYRLGVHPKVPKPAYGKLLPRAEREIGVNSEWIIGAIYRIGNFRLWVDLLGAASEYVLGKRFGKSEPIVGKRNTKKDYKIDGVTYQTKMPSTNRCKFNKSDPIIAIETQLSRHKGEKRLYNVTDFDGLIIAINPMLNKWLCNRKEWEYVFVPSEHLEKDNRWPNKYKYIQRFEYSWLKRYVR